MLAEEFFDDGNQKEQLLKRAIQELKFCFTCLPGQLPSPRTAFAVHTQRFSSWSVAIKRATSTAFLTNPGMLMFAAKVSHVHRDSCEMQVRYRWRRDWENTADREVQPADKKHRNRACHGMYHHPQKNCVCITIHKNLDLYSRGLALNVNHFCSRLAYGSLICEKRKSLDGPPHGAHHR